MRFSAYMRSAWKNMGLRYPSLVNSGSMICMRARGHALQGNRRAKELRVVDTQQIPSGKIPLLVDTPDDACCKVTDFTYPIRDGTWHCSE